MHGAQSLSLSYGFIHDQNVFKDLRGTNFYFVIICCLCVWLHWVPNKSHIDATSVMLCGRESNVFTGLCFPRDFYKLIHMQYERTLQPFLWCWQVVYSAGMVNSLSVFFIFLSTEGNQAPWITALQSDSCFGQWPSGNCIISYNTSYNH